MEVFVRVQYIVSEKLISVPVKLTCSAPQDRVDVAAAIPALGRVIQRSLYLEFLNHIRVWQRHIIVLRHVVICRADAFDQIVVVVLALAVHEYLCGPAAQLRRSVQFAVRAGAERQQLLVVLRSKGKFTNGFGPDGLPRRGVGGFHRRQLRGDFDLLRHCSGFQRDRYARSLRDAHFDP